MFLNKINDCKSIVKYDFFFFFFFEVCFITCIIHCVKIQKQLFTRFLVNNCSDAFFKIYRKHRCRSIVLKSYSSKACSIIEKETLARFFNKDLENFQDSHF